MRALSIANSLSACLNYVYEDIRGCRDNSWLSKVPARTREGCVSSRFVSANRTAFISSIVFGVVGASGVSRNIHHMEQRNPISVWLALFVYITHCEGKAVIFAFTRTLAGLARAFLRLRLGDTRGDSNYFHNRARASTCAIVLVYK